MINGKFTTSEAAQQVGISLATINRWIDTKKVKAPEATLVGAVGYRLWSSDDIQSLKLTKKRIYWKGGGRKKGKKSRKQESSLAVPSTNRK
jgi:excisionase family DNA binding protein